MSVIKSPFIQNPNRLHVLLSTALGALDGRRKHGVKGESRERVRPTSPFPRRHPGCPRSNPGPGVCVCADEFLVVPTLYHISRSWAQKHQDTVYGSHFVHHECDCCAQEGGFPDITLYPAFYWLGTFLATCGLVRSRPVSPRTIITCDIIIINNLYFPTRPQPLMHSSEQGMTAGS